ncbi:FAD-binding oxidoreductase [Paucilactobacillus suebicus]|uniref:Ferric reductase n=1 Tax=Paucilactobacillus suebicus DSM 5007 = KCTC 3549 TaxID=1423807 RepID=A0A0R1W3A2_9LACO|nr:FAD-binding oxidoreductase [Paucilactobacillus suebicus]KRM12321.1 ferric reductase [Paucilactobacillus suebicus DSM 5007 = KCTC 3549]
MLKKFPYTFGLAWLVVLFVIPLPLIQALALGLPSIYASESLAIQLGSIAYVWFLTAIYLSTRPKWIDRLIGLPNMYFIHGVLSIFAIGLAFIHKTQLSSGGLIRMTGNWAFDLFLGVMIYSLVFMAGWLTNRIKLLGALKKWLEKIFKHELSVWIHRLNIIAVVLVFIHVQLISYITSIHSYMAIFYLYTAFVTVAYLYKKIKDFRFLPVGHLIAKQELKPNFFEFDIKVKYFQFRHLKPGDFVFIKIPEQRGLKELHPFSVVNRIDKTGVVKLAIRGDGDFTKKIQQLELGELIQIDGGYGRFNEVITDNKHDDLVLVTGGTGIVPMLSIIEGHPERKIDLFYSVHNQNDQVYIDQLNQWAEDRNNLTVNVQTGRFKTNEVLTEKISKQSTFLISGPRALGKNWVHALSDRHISSHKYYYEEFNW